MDERTEQNIIIERRRRKERYPLSLLILPLFVLAFGLLVYVANNRNIVPSSSTNGLITPGLSPASGRVQVGVGGGPKDVTTTPSVSPTPSKKPTPSTMPTITGTSY